ncbi:MAG: PAS domain-containing protein [Nitrospirae bacterium]|nr:PAS domain-containing protein [Nitrospirota bacterium]
MGERGGMGFGAVAKFGALFFAVLLAVLSVSGLSLLSRTRAYLEEDLDKRLRTLSEIIPAEIESRYPESITDPYYLYAITVRESLAGLTVLDKDGSVVSDATELYKSGEKYEPLGITAGEYTDVVRGATRSSPIIKRKGKTVRSVFFPVRAEGGSVALVGVLTLDAGYIDDLTQQGTTNFILKSVAFVFLIIILLYVIRSLVMSQRGLVNAVRGEGLDEVVGRSPGDNVSFMVGAFHTMVEKLKEKEKELQELKEQAEQRAKSIESYNEDILKSISSGVMTFGLDGAVRTANQAAYDILGRPSGSAVGKNAGDVFGADGWVTGLIKKTLDNALPEKRGEGEVRTADGRSRWLGAGASPLFGVDGAMQGAILVFTDITEVKELRERMELKERMTVLGDMSAGIAHELRNPLGVISGYAELLARRLGDDAQGKDAVKSIQDEVRVMDEIIREFMSFSQPTELNITEVDVRSLVEEAMKAVSGAGEGVVRRLSLPEGQLLVEGDWVLLRQAFVNMMKNAIDAMPEGGSLSVTVGSADPETAEVGLPGTHYIRIDITDTGSGIAEKDLKKIFTPFFTTKPKGTGLGLALVQKILVYHGGRAIVKSAPGKGSTFSVYLPAKTL